MTERDLLTLAVPPELVELIVGRVAEIVAGSLEIAPPPDPWRLLSTADVAAALGRSERWVRDHKDAIGWVRLDGGPPRFRMEDVQAFADARRIDAGREGV
jgi:hypothetical protein